MTRRPLTAVEREAWGLLDREFHTLDPREWWEIQSRMREAFATPERLGTPHHSDTDRF